MKQKDALLQRAREKFVKLAGGEKTVGLAETELLDGIPAPAEQVLEQEYSPLTVDPRAASRDFRSAVFCARDSQKFAAN